MKKKSKTTTTFKWIMRTGFGKLNFLYSSIFDGKNYISLKPLSFEESRMKNFENCIKNPNMFASYFELNEEKVRTNNSYCSSEKKIKKIQFDYLDSIILCLFKVKDDEICLSDFKEFENMEIDYHLSKRNDFEFDENGVFFKTEFLVYEQV